MRYLLICALLVISSHSFAKLDNIYLSSGVEKSSLTLNGTEVDLENGIFFKIGYPFILAPDYNLVVEFEYNNIGNYGHYLTDSLSYDNVEIEASSIGMNLKYQSYLFDSNFYLASILGVHQYSLDLMVDSLSHTNANGTTLQTTISGEKSIKEVGLSYGVEIGYSLPYSLNIAASYTMGRVISDGIAIDLLSSQLILSYIF